MNDYSEYQAQKSALQNISQTNYGGPTYEADSTDCRRIGALLHMKLLPSGYALRVMQELFDLPQKPAHFADCCQGPVLAVLLHCFDVNGEPTSFGRGLILSAYEVVKSTEASSA